MARSQIESISFSGIKDHQVPDKELSLREIVLPKVSVVVKDSKDVSVKKM